MNRVAMMMVLLASPCAGAATFAASDLVAAAWAEVPDRGRTRVLAVGKEARATLSAARAALHVDEADVHEWLAPVGRHGRPWCPPRPHPQPVPLPAAAWLFMGGAAGLAAVGRRRRAV